MKEEIRIFFTALMFYTRIPCPKHIDHSPEYISKATRYFPLIGWIVGACSFVSYWVFSWLFGLQIGVVFSLIVGALITGAFHEDGFADVFDGFGGGWTKQQILEIMKDSRIGTFGVLALICMTLLKTFSLIEIIHALAHDELFVVFLVFISYHALSRLTSIQLTFLMQYAREDEFSKAKPIAKAYTYREVLGSYLWGLIPLFSLVYYHPFTLFALLPLIAVVFYAKWYFQKWTQGYTGDILGAVEQIAECIILLSFVAIWRFLQ